MVKFDLKDHANSSCEFIQLIYFFQAIKALEIALKCDPIIEEDLTIEKELIELHKKYSIYR